jgi:hypothetical protein
MTTNGDKTNGPAPQPGGPEPSASQLTTPAPKGNRAPPAPTTMPGEGQSRNDSADDVRPLPAATTLPGSGDSME